MTDFRSFNLRIPGFSMTAYLYKPNYQGVTKVPYEIYKNGNTCSLTTGHFCFIDYSLKDIKIRLRELLQIFKDSYIKRQNE